MENLVNPCNGTPGTSCSVCLWETEGKTDWQQSINYHSSVFDWLRSKFASSPAITLCMCLNVFLYAYQICLCSAAMYGCVCVCVCLFRQSIYLCSQPRVCVCVTGPGSVPQRNHPVSLHVSSSSPGGITLLSRCTDQRADTCPDVLSLSFSSVFVSLSLFLCLSCNLNPLPLSLTLSFCPYIQVSPRLYQWGFWLHYWQGQSFLCRQGEWRNNLHTLSDLYARANRYTHNTDKNNLVVTPEKPYLCEFCRKVTHFSVTVTKYIWTWCSPKITLYAVSAFTRLNLQQLNVRSAINSAWVGENIFLSECEWCHRVTELRSHSLSG